MDHKKYKVGLVIGRFQPFHNGHVFLIRKSLEIAEKIIIGIGSPNKNLPTQKKIASIHPRYAYEFKEAIKRYKIDNPINAQSRINMIHEFIKREHIQDRVLKVVLLFDHPDDSIWLSRTLKKVGNIDVVIGNNEWVNMIFKKADYPIIEISHFKRNILEGKKIRVNIRTGKKWEDRVPHFLVSEVQNHLGEIKRYQ